MLDAGDGRRDLFRFYHRFHQPLAVRLRIGVFDRDRTDLGDFHAVGVRDVDGEPPSRLPDRAHHVRQYFPNHQPAKGARLEGFVKEKAPLYGSEAKAQERAIPCQAHASTRAFTQVFALILCRPGFHGADFSRTSVRVDNGFPINFLRHDHVQKLDGVL